MGVLHRKKMNRTSEEEMRAGHFAQRTGGRKQVLNAPSPAWSKYKSSGLTDQMITAIQKYDKNMNQEGVLNECGPLVVEGLVKMISHTMVVKEIELNDLKYVLAMISEMLEVDRSRVALFRELTTVNPFEKLLNVLMWSKDEMIMRLASHSLAVMIYPGLGFGPPRVDQSLDELAKHCKDNLDGDKLNKSSEEVHKMIDLA